MSAPHLPAVLAASAPASEITPLDQGSFRPHPPGIDGSGRKPGQDLKLVDSVCDSENVAQVALPPSVMGKQAGASGGSPRLDEQTVFDQSPPETGRQTQLPATVREGLSLIDEARPPRNIGGRPKAIDDVAKVKIATLLATGASLRQVAGFLGVSHSTVSAAIAADPALKQEIDAARQRAALHPLACIVRESGRNWKAAVWLMEYLNKQAASALPPAERNREEAEAKAAVLIQSDLAGELRQQAKNHRLAQERREEDEQWRQEIAARKAKKLARAQRQQPARGAAPPTPSQAAAPP